MNILLGWELGAGQGHIQRLAALAKALQEQGHTPVMALKSYNLNGQPFPWNCVLAPRLPFSGRETSYSLADILESFGFGDVNLLDRHIQAWQAVLQEIQPALVITDHAPGLVLAAQGRIPTLVIGSHFAVPPLVDILPILRFPAPPESRDRQTEVAETVRRITTLDKPLGQILNGDRSFIFSIPELDCYRPWRQNPTYVGIHNAPLPVLPRQSAGTTWAYLAKNYDYRNLVVQTLAADCTFQPLHQALVDKSLAIHHGGLTTTIGCLFTGIPQLLFPRYLEQQLTAVSLVRLGIAEMIKTPTWENLLIAQARLSLLTERARELAQELACWNHNQLDTVVQAGLEFIC